MIATNNGSYPWKEMPAGGELRELLESNAGRAADPDRVRLLQDSVTRQIIDEQASAGLDLITDGLVRRGSPMEPVARGLGGLRIGEDRIRYPGRPGLVAQPLAESEIQWKEPILVEDYLFAGRGAPRPVKVVLTGPYTIANLTEDRVYGDPNSLAMALAIALNRELRALQAAGAMMIQIDEPALLERKDDFPVFTRVWEVLGRGVSATLTLHLEGGGIGGLYPGLTRLKRLGCLSLDVISGPESLALFGEHPLPAPIMLGLGVVDGRIGGIETPEAIMARLRDAPGLPPGDRLLLGPASDLGDLPRTAATAKLRALSRAARLLEQRT